MVNVIEDFSQSLVNKEGLNLNFLTKMHQVKNLKEERQFSGELKDLKNNKVHKFVRN